MSEPESALGAALRTSRIRPRIVPGTVTRSVGAEAVVLPEVGDRVHALNPTCHALWKLCDGRRSMAEIVAELVEVFDADPAIVAADVAAALLELESLGLVTVPGARDVDRWKGATSEQSDPSRPRVRFVFGVEDRPYFHWQLAILCESLVGQMPEGWDVSAVVCNDHGPISEDLLAIARVYDLRLLTGESRAEHHVIDFTGGHDRYVPMNRVEALNVVRHHVEPEDLVCLMDTDVFLYGALDEDVFPIGNAMARNWIIAEERYFGFSIDGAGVSLPRLLESLGVEGEFKPGGVTVFLTGDTLTRDGLVADVFRWLQTLFLLGKILRAPKHGVWVSEMASFALAASAAGVDYELLDVEQFAVQEQHRDTVPQGSFYHYYTDINDGSSSRGPFEGSQWHKQLFHDRNMLDADLASFRDVARGELERRFFDLAIKARDRLGRTSAPPRES